MIFKTARLQNALTSSCHLLKKVLSLVYYDSLQVVAFLPPPPPPPKNRSINSVDI